MPEQIILDITKSDIDKIAQSKDTDTSNENILVKLKVQVVFSKDEFDFVKNYIKRNEKFELLKIKAPGLFNLMNVLTEEIISQQIAKLVITINEKDNDSSSAMLEYT